MACPACGRAFTPAGRRRFCCDACRAAAYRRRRGAACRPVPAIPALLRRASITVYGCDACGDRAVGQQRCASCGTFMRRLGTGGACPGCDEPVTVAELIGMEVGP